MGSDSYRATTIAGMRDMLDYLEENEDVPMPYLSQADAFVSNDKDKAIRELAAVARCPGKWKKVAEDEWYRLEQHFGPITLHVNSTRDLICERVQVGIKTIPAREAFTVDATAERTEPIYELVCPDSILALANNKETTDG